MTEPSPHIDGVSPEVDAPGDPVARSGAGDERRASGDAYRRMPEYRLPEALIARGPQTDADAFRSVEGAPQDEPVDDAKLAPWALFAAIVALATSMFVGWGIPVAVVSVIAAIMSLRRPVENRAIAMWALVLGIAATVFSLGWLIWAAMQFESMG
ncbi:MULTISPECIES: hypothetical protein [Microbacterium]|uniref:hypothetical protein n=1 Tax=Microbacterium TaxID=33882 RepID=UPI00217D33C9|nr:MULTISPECIES: hypothetical protein [Microbacterium]UWF77918.1 hypothetical protein JSY13_02325 [Microbacterium neungamense]WCM56095.1 hypothetical protein JRG78_02370 [Microbacterium sp. EF45047]